MKNSSKYILFFIVFLVVVVLMLFINSTSFQKARNSCKLFKEFQNYIKNDNWEKAEEILYPFDANQEYSSYEFSFSSNIENRPVIKNGKLMSMNGDVTDFIIRVKPSFWDTYNSHDDNVILTNGYIMFKNGKIIVIKFP